MGHGATSSRDGHRRLESRVAALGDAVERLTSDASGVFSCGESANAGLVEENRDRICAAATECAEFALARIAKRQPSPVEFRTIVAALAISDEYRRIADLAAEIVRHSHLARLLPEMPVLETDYCALQRIAVDQLRSVVTAQRNRDEGLCRAVWEGDRAVDTAQDRVFASTVRMLALAPRIMLTVVDTLLCARDFERIADHVATIADMVVFARTGRRIHADGRSAGMIQGSFSSAA